MNIIIEGPYFGKATVCMHILHSLPEWFGLEESLNHYSTEINNLPTFLSLNAAHVIGFISLKQHYSHSAEIYVMGVNPEMHHKGAGRALINQAQVWLKSQGVTYLQVKTLGPSHPDEGYARTRAFYEKMGFKPLEEIRQIWDEQNPCLIMIKKI